MSARTKSRKRAVDALFAADLRDASPEDLLEESAKANEDRQNQAEIIGYARQIVLGCLAQGLEIDDLINAYSQNWALDRMPTLDRSILRVAIWEMLHNPEVPVAVAISEAVELAKEYSTDESPGFINGLLNAIANSREAR